jgi:hypothetical protein
LTVNDIRRLLNALIIQPAHYLGHRLHWSLWRRHHQHQARQAHHKRRLTLELQA